MVSSILRTRGIRAGLAVALLVVAGHPLMAADPLLGPRTDTQQGGSRPSGSNANHAIDDRQGRPPGSLPFTWPWWNDADVRRDLALSEEKARRIDEIYQTRLRMLKPYVDEFLKQLGDLERMTAERTADEASYELKVAHVESLRSKLSESRTMMLYKMYRQLDPEQYQKLRRVIERRLRSWDGRERER